MMPRSALTLIEKLSPAARRAFGSGSALCQSLRHFDFEIEHWLLGLFNEPDTDLAALCRFYEISVPHAVRDLMRRVEGLPKGSPAGTTHDPEISVEVAQLIVDAWLFASLEFRHRHVRSSDLLCAILDSHSVSRRLCAVAPELSKIRIEGLRADIPSITERTGEAVEDAGTSATESVAQKDWAETGPTQTPFLDQFTVDLTKEAREGKIDPIAGRDDEIRQIVDILTRRRQNNPILIGEAGVGKTAVVEGFALRIAAGDVPPALKPVSIRSLDMGLLLAGAGVKGEFERRLKGVIDEVRSSTEPVVLFIDEAHNMIGAGGQSGAGDAANLVKPALARGELRTIAATTFEEYKKYFENDPALTRRFQPVRVDEPNEGKAIAMMRGLLGALERHHRVRIRNDAVEAAVRLSTRYVAGRQLPDKCVALLDTACARVAISQSTTPAAIEALNRQLHHEGQEIDILEREERIGHDHRRRLAELRHGRTSLVDRLKALEQRWQTEKSIVDEVLAVKRDLEKAESSPVGSGGPEPSNGVLDRASLRARLVALEKQYAELVQSDAPMLAESVDANVVASVVSDWTGIPIGKMLAKSTETILNLEEELTRSVIGQTHALREIAEKVRISRADLGDPRKPIGVFMMIGPSGVGKTETALSLARAIYGSSRNLVVINMSEFKEEHKVSMLMGSPPGYVGYGKGGVLTEAVRRRPYSLVLLDEVDKAHPGVYDVFNQVFDKGILRDSEGRDVDFKNTIIIMTSNHAAESISKLCADPATRPEPQDLLTAIHPELTKKFRREFLARVSLIPYYPLTDGDLRAIAALQLQRIADRLATNHRAAFSYSQAFVDSIISRCAELDTGARSIESILSQTVLPAIADRLLRAFAVKETVSEVALGLDGEQKLRIDIK